MGSLIERTPPASDSGPPSLAEGRARAPSFLDADELRAADKAVSHPPNTSESTEASILELSCRRRVWSSSADSKSLQQKVRDFKTSTEGGEILAVFVGLLGSFSKGEVKPDGHYRPRIRRDDIDFLRNEMSIHPAFVPLFLGRSNYWAPRIYREHLEDQENPFIAMFVQFRQFKLGSYMTPCSVYLRYELKTGKSFYLISSIYPGKFLNVINEDFSGNKADFDSIITDNPLVLLARFSQIFSEKSGESFQWRRRKINNEIWDLDKLTKNPDLTLSETWGKLAKSARELYMQADEVTVMIGRCKQAAGIIKHILELQEELMMPGRTEIDWLAPQSVETIDALSYMLASYKDEQEFLESLRQRADMAKGFIMTVMQRPQAIGAVAPAPKERERSKTRDFGRRRLNLNSALLCLALGLYVYGGASGNWMPIAVLFAVALLDSRGTWMALLREGSGNGQESDERDEKSSTVERPESA